MDFPPLKSHVVWWFQKLDVFWWTWYLMWNNGPCICLKTIATSCDIMDQVGPLFHMRFFMGKNLISVHQTTWDFWVHQIYMRCQKMAKNDLGASNHMSVGFSFSYHIICHQMLKSLYAYEVTKDFSLGRNSSLFISLLNGRKWVFE